MNRFASPSSAVAAAIVLAFTGAATAADAPASAPGALYSLSAPALPGENGKVPAMTLRETQRAAEFSIVDVEADSEAGRSFDAPLFLVRGLCGLMMARGQKLALAEQVSERPIEFKMTFPDQAAVNDGKGLPRMVLSEANCAAFQAHPERP